MALLRIAFIKACLQDAFITEDSAGTSLVITASAIIAGNFSYRLEITGSLFSRPIFPMAGRSLRGPSDEIDVTVGRSDVGVDDSGTVSFTRAAVFSLP